MFRKRTELKPHACNISEHQWFAMWLMDVGRGNKWPIHPLNDGWRTKHPVGWFRKSTADVYTNDGYVLNGALVNQYGDDAAMWYEIHRDLRTL